jgi:hypothetical protein
MVNVRSPGTTHRTRHLIPPFRLADCSNSSVCNLVLSTSPIFLRFWLNEDCRNALLRNVDRDTLPALRLVCHNFASSAAPILFSEVTVNFKVSSFTKPGRMSTLNRIGRHVKRFTFKAPHSAEAFLPPLLDPLNGEQLSFAYVPQVESPTRSKGPKYGSWEMDDVLIHQYPPIFHAATNIPSFIRAFSAMPNMEHISIYSPDQNMVSKYRRSTADYCLVSLRIAIERAPLNLLDSLSLHSLHPTALINLQPVLSFGSNPSSCRRWTQIRHLALEMDSIPFSWPKPDDHIRTIQSYMRSFAVTLTHFSFRWSGAQGPSPLSLQSEPPIWTPSLGQYQYPHHKYSASFPPATPPKDCHLLKPSASASPIRSSPAKPLRFFALKHMILENCELDAPQIAAFIARHRGTLTEFRFEDVYLRNGDWATTLDPLRKLKRLERAKHVAALAASQRRRAGSAGSEDTLCDEDGMMDVPCVMHREKELSVHVCELDEEPVILGTLEPQVVEPEPWVSGVKRWFGVGSRRNEGPGVRKHERKVSDHLKRVLNGGIFGWR